ncbi:hypothetical protein SAMN05428988_4378 [Chitinophaga sp. YR573]|uniref:hypothetical protein n=1 Tax=Chitinophaga sp. YR573 TaxID=1881040 RepID=UPI0008CB44D3|nr:hypothetical protein [Chitinophaga sp. YR573]SEW35708.1 hypothetical protein SAMN05428988_4378 [Chitinophaga sp. YR573]
MNPYLIPFIAAFIGWFANWLTIKFLFRNRKQLINEQIRSKLTSPENIQSILPVVETHMDIFLKEKLPEAMPVFKMFIGESTTQQVKNVLMKELDSMFPVIINQYLQNIDAESLIPVKLKKLFPIAGAALGFLLGLLFILLSHHSS